VHEIRAIRDPGRVAGDARQQAKVGPGVGDAPRALIFYAAFGSSRHLITGLMSATAALSAAGDLQRSAPNPQWLRGSIRRAPGSQPQVAVGSEVHAQAAVLNVMLAHLEQIVGAVNVLTEVKLGCDGRCRQIVDGDDR
jgi:hypothetical protein